MKRVLLSTTALVAASLLVTSVAYAGDEEMAEGEMMDEEMMMAEPVSVGISGSYRVIFGASSHDSSPALYEYLEPVVSGSATMDNGLTFGVSAWIGASGDWNTYDRTVSIGGAFGDISIGATRSARGKMRIGSAGATSSFGVNDPYQPGKATVVKTANSGAGIANRDTKIVYMSPSLGGIQVGASYAPDGTVSEQIAAGLTFTQDLGDASVSINVGYETADDGDEDSPTDLNAGASISVGDITLSGGMRDSSGGTAGDHMQTDVGASIAMGAATLSAGWGSSEDANMYALGAAYPLGEGVQLDVQLDFGNDDNKDAPDDEWVQFMIGTAISF